MPQKQRSKTELVGFEFGKLGNYGTQLVVKIDDGFPILSLENWAYGETQGCITTREGVTPENLEKLGKELILAAETIRSYNEELLRKGS